MRYSKLSLVLTIGIASAANFNAQIKLIPKTIQQKMIGVTWHQECPVPLSDLRYITLSYWGFDHKAHQGVLIVNRHLAKQTVSIFKQLFSQRFPIAKMQPVYHFQGSDELAMEANDTSSFNCRAMTGQSKKFSQHSYGRAIDINTRMNPYIKETLVLPKNAGQYRNRQLGLPGMIEANGVVTQAFKQAGWDWGGNWFDLKDYQHFEKRANHAHRNPWGAGLPALAKLN